MLAGTEGCTTQNLAGAMVREFECLRCHSQPYKVFEFRKVDTSVDVTASWVVHDATGSSKLLFGFVVRSMSQSVKVSSNLV